MVEQSRTLAESIEIVEFSNQSKADKRLLRQFVDFHWQHYQNDRQYVPLLDYEYLGFGLLGIKGFFEADNLFFKHAKIRFFLARQDGKTIGRCMAFVNYNHNLHWNDKVGFFGMFETIDNPEAANRLIEAAANWLRNQGMDTIRGPQNFPVNEATPGVMVSGFDSRPVIYYHYNKPYYESLLLNCGFSVVKRVLSWETRVQIDLGEKLERVARKVIDRFGVKIEPWSQRPLTVRKQEMLEIYNDAWNDNFGFVPFTQEEFYRIIDDMMLIMDKGLFIFLYVNDEPVAFFGGVPNVTEKMTPNGRFELLRAAKMLLNRPWVKGFRLGYLGVKRKYRRMGLDGVMLWQQYEFAKKKGYEYCDMGWVLEDNVLVHRLVAMTEGKPSKTYAILEKSI